MKKFVLDLLLFVAINCLFAGLLYARYRVADDYLAAVNDKLDRMERTSPPRILLCGGSSVAWSSHSQLIKDTVGMDVQNLAYHAGLGLSMRINEAKMLAKPGDVLVMSIEWAVLSDKPRSRIMAESILACPRSFQFANWRDKKLVMDGLLPAVRMPFASLVNDLKEQQNFSAFSVELARKRKKWRLRENFNEFGDFQGHYEESRIGFAGRPIYFPTLDELETSIDRLNELHAWCNEHSVRMFYFIPLIPERYYLENEELVIDYVNHLSKLTCPILNADHVYLPDESFFDSAYHLCKIAGEERSQLLADRLATLVNAADR